jgi:hypothetical protein
MSDDDKAAKKTAKKTAKKAAEKVVARPLNTADRNALNKLIVRRKDTVLNALGSELGHDANKVAEELRHQKGIVMTEGQYLELIEGIDEQIKAEVGQRVQRRKQEIEIETSEIEDDYLQKDQEMKRKHAEEFKALLDEKKKKKQEARNKLRTLEQDVAREHASELLQKKMGYQKEASVLKQQEAEIRAEAQRRVTVISKSRDRLVHIVDDATNRALETLWTTEDRQEAQELINRIPTVGEAIEMCASPDGLRDLFKRLDPNVKALPAPLQEEEEGNTKDVEVVTINAEIVPTSVDDDDEEEDADYAERERRREVYGSGRHRDW